MKREEILKRQGFTVGDKKKKRVIILSDIDTEADDDFAIVHHLLSQTEDVRGIVAVHFEWKYTVSDQMEHLRGTSMQQCYEEGQRLLSLMEIDDVPLLRGSVWPLWMQDKVKGCTAKQAVRDVNGCTPETTAQDVRCPDGAVDYIFPQSEGADFIIQEAMKEEESPLYIACLGALTDLAIALHKKPEIASRMTAIVIGGAAYPQGGSEPNFREDPQAAQIVFSSGMDIWQIPMNVYSTMEVSLAEVADKVKPCGKIGAYLWEQMMEVNDFYAKVPMRMTWPHGESWSLGDNPTVVVLLQNAERHCWHMQKAPIIREDCSYEENPDGHEIRVYDFVDARLGLGDLFSKLRLCYGREVF